MIPISDGVRQHYTPATIFLVLVSTLVFLYQAFVGTKGLNGYVLNLGLVPYELTRHYIDSLRPWQNLIASLFMHGGLLHLISNMLFLWIFGDNIENAMGSFRFLVFYLFAGAVASATHVFMHPMSNVPLVGASGAIAGVMGAYFVLFPRNRILVLIPILFYITTARIPAFLFLAFWFLMQLLYSSMGGQVAWWAHIGGFLAGIVFVLPFKRRVSA